MWSQDYKMTDSPLKMVVFTDLDGTLLDPVTYSHEKALPSVAHLQHKGIPIIFCSSKTRREQEAHRQKMGIQDPFIVENGGAIFIPEGYFPFRFDYHKTRGIYQVIELGRPYREVRRMLGQIRAEAGVSFKGFGDMTAEEVAMDAGLDLQAARRARAREYDETIKLEGTREEIERVLEAVKKAGLNYARGGRYYDVTGGNDKGKAAAILTGLFRQKLGRVETIGIGDSANDLPLLSVVDIPILVQKPGQKWEETDLPNLKRIKGIGPEGWDRAIKELIGGNNTGENPRPA